MTVLLKEANDLFTSPTYLHATFLISIVYQRPSEEKYLHNCTL